MCINFVMCRSMEGWNHLRSRAPLPVFPENKCLGILFPMNRSLSPFLSPRLHCLLSLLITFDPLTSSTLNSLLCPLLLLLDASRILDLTFASPSSSSSIISPSRLAFIAINDFDLLLFLNRYSTSVASRPCSSRVSLILDMDLFFW